MTGETGGLTAEEREALRQRLYVALVEQRVIDSRHYGEPPYAPITREVVDAALASLRPDPNPENRP